MNTIICAGGTGSRFLEAVLHLCAAGLGPPALRLLAVDPDSANGNGDRLNSMLQKYLECRRIYGGRVPGHNLFGTAIDLLGERPDDGRLEFWSPLERGQTLGDLLNYDGLPDGKVRDVVRLLFTREEREMQLDEGFRGRPAIGAAAMATLTLQRGKRPWRQLIQRLTADVNQPEGARVFVAASVFGGTGASAIHPIVRFLRSIPALKDRRKLHIGVASMTPYFSFYTDGKDRELVAQAEWFQLATRSAVDYYDQLHKNKDWDFDAMYWLGDNSPKELSYSPGGPSQKNPGHFVDLLAALACLGFFRKPVKSGLCRYSGPRWDVEPARGETNLLEWPDIPLEQISRDELRHALLRFHLLGVAHRGFFAPLVESPELYKQPWCAPWYYHCFTKRGDSYSLDTEDNQAAMRRLNEFFRDYHHPWLKQVHEHDGVRLFSRGGLPQNGAAPLDRIANLLYPDKPTNRDREVVDDYFAEVNRAARSHSGDTAPGAYLSLLAHAADTYIGRNYFGRN